MMGLSTWKEYASDFDSMTDEEIARETNEAEAALTEAENWLEAVASWMAAGKPRTPDEVAA